MSVLLLVIHRSRTFLSAAVLAVVALGAAFHAGRLRPAIRPGSPLLNANRIQVSRDTFTIINGQRAVGRAVVQTGLDRRHGRLLIIRSEQHFNARDQLVHVDSFALDAATLRPLFQQSIDGRQAQRLFFSETRIRGVQLNRSGERSIDLALDGPLFYASSLDLVLGALPLHPSFTGELAVFDADSASRKTTRVQVTAREVVCTGSGRPCASWRVETDGPQGKVAYWIGTRSRKLIRYSIPKQNLVYVRRRGCQGVWPIGSTPSLTRTAARTRARRRPPLHGSAGT